MSDTGRACSCDHLTNLRVGVNEQQLHPRVCKSEDTEYLVGKCLADCRNIREVEDDRAKQIDSGENALRLGSGDQRVSSILSHDDGYDSSAEIVVFTGHILIE